jgi:O-antigen biosynthesis protein
MDKIPRILYVARDDGGCGFFRCRQPADFIKRMGLAETRVVQTVASEEDMLAADLIVFQETGSVVGSNMAKFCAENKIPYVTEFDDFVQHISPRNLGGWAAWNPGTLYIHRAMEMMKGAMGVTVSTPQLAREYFPYNPYIYVVPNFLDKSVWDNSPAKKLDGKIRIGWIGGNAHADDLRMVSKVLDKLVKRYKGKVIFETMGMTAQELAGVFPMQATDSTCPSCGYEGELHHFPGEAQQDYPMVLASKGWDIAIAPVISNAFGNCKSDLKLKEYAAAGIPVVASPITPYLEASLNNAQVLFATTFEEWYNNLDKLIRNPKLRDSMVKANKEWIGKNWIDDNAQMIFGVYQQILDRSKLVLGTKEDRLKKRNLL